MSMTVLPFQSLVSSCNDALEQSQRGNADIKLSLELRNVVVANEAS